MDSFRTSIEPVLGTRLTMRVDVTAEHSGGGVASTVAESAFEAALAEADRLDETLSQFRPDSAFNRWRQGDGPAPVELVAILEAAQRWFELSEGAFHPGLGRVVERWRAAERLGILPHPAEIAALAARPLPFTARNASLSTRGDLGAVDIHGIAKGWVVDRMLDAALTIDGVEAAMVDLGGDIAHGGSPEHPVRIAVEHPFDVADNARALTTIRLGRQAIATSAGGRRGFNVAGQWLGHLIDPRSGWPLPGTRSCTAIAATAADADAAASAGAVRGCDGGETLASRGDVALLIIEEDGSVWRSASWQRIVAEIDAGDQPSPERTATQIRTTANTEHTAAVTSDAWRRLR